MRIKTFFLKLQVKVYCDGDEYKATFEHTFSRDGHKSLAKFFEVGRLLFLHNALCSTEFDEIGK